MIQILWDSSHLWGLMAWHGLKALGVSCQLILAKDISQGCLIRNPPAVLMVPGGSARKKAAALGASGQENIRKWVQTGGKYLGICGGAGLALTQKNKSHGLALCPWERRAYPDRLYHLLSGSLLAATGRGVIPLPVWWPGRFEEGVELDVLARYIGPGADLWLSDLPMMEVPAKVRHAWHEARRLDLTLDFPPDQPLVVSGHFGAGSYILSYAHLETPDYGPANEWLSQMLGTWANIQVKNACIPQWMQKPQPPYSGYGASIAKSMIQIQNLVALGKKLGLFFERTPWLAGWRHGSPGMACNNLAACLYFLHKLPHSKAGCNYWQDNELPRKIGYFWELAREFLWNWRLAATLGKSRTPLESQRDKIFGHPMLGGGITEELLLHLEHLIWLEQPPD